MPGQVRLCAMLALAVLAALPASAADLREPVRAGRFLATCEHLGRFCSADGCGRDQIDAALACRALCPGSVTLRVVPARCPLPEPVVLRRRG